jgi:DNA-binding LacI/PurR family transcriptional regulator
LADASIACDDSLIEAGDWSFESGEVATGRLLERAPHVTAIFAQNDQMAIGAIRALRAAGRRVPEDVEVIGYDDIPVARYYHPTLSTVSQPMREVGRMAVQLLLDRISDPYVEPREVLIKPTLVRRESTGEGARQKEVTD